LERTFSEEDFAGMTVNERLSLAGLVGAYDAAIAEGDAEKLREVLAKTHIGDANIEAIVRSKLARNET